ncbi:type II restriction endonuclease [Klebsiella pneumoniae]|uniref:type II restriction endonuclease n=1 Tax=Enterobacteriaceae TaxID=543 RepID=UPI00190E9785|nr:MULTISPECIES: type II restriction endonuclease [Klebsiella]GKO88977.1 type II restriction endonuclease [Klebsiella variicola]HBU6427475.1 restriction endonuclease [Klebsiella oxytoca]HCI8860435.1 restriction endonuclease [Klebsiella variicola]
MDHRLRDIFRVAAGKHLSAVDADLSRSHQHEIGGLVKVGFGDVLGRPGKEEAFRFACKMVYITDEMEEPLIEDDHVTWYDSRRKSPHRSPEYRLYYHDNSVTELIQEGDFFLIAQQTNGNFLMCFAPADTSIEAQLRNLFGLTNQLKEKFQSSKISDKQLLLPVQLLLEQVGINFELEHEENEVLLETLLELFPQGLPKSHEFSELARSRRPASPLAHPDEALMTWLAEEELLFRTYERYLVRNRLLQGFGHDGGDVDAFVDFSLSVQNRRKSRVGFAFENHLSHLFKLHGLTFEKGSSKNTTENKSKPDFLFPSFKAYHDISYPPEKLILLGAKTTCKDRWRQVLAEGDRVPNKHLVTIQPGISYSQLSEMKSKSLQLVVPYQLWESYPESVRDELISLKQFIALVLAKN